MGSRASLSASVSAWEGNAPPSLVWIARSTVCSPTAPTTKPGSIDDRNDQTYRGALTGPAKARIFSNALATGRQNGEL